MSFFYISNTMKSSKSLSNSTGYYDYKDEHTYHVVCFNNSYYSAPIQFSIVWALVVIAPYWEERG